MVWCKFRILKKKLLHKLHLNADEKETYLKEIHPKDLTKYNDAMIKSGFVVSYELSFSLEDFKKYFSQNRARLVPFANRSASKKYFV